MPSFKRTQVSSDSEEQSEGGSESGSSNPTLHSRKRARTSASPTFSDESEANDRDSPAASSYDDDADDDADEEELALRQTQIIEAKYAQLIDEANVPAENGILERVECYNFMCHNHFSVELGPLINFIVGKNGSGKSAILTAITLCLGGKASATNRGQSLRSFIKEGKENASIIVRIKNQGDGAYLPDDYGKSIIVERHFTRSGASGFKIKNEQGRIISTKKAELDAITDYFSLQIDNPMNVLSQDMARQFLSSSSPAEKYKFFVKGVQLEQLDQDYRLIEESVDQIEEKLRTQEPNLRFLQNQRDMAKNKLDLSDQQDLLRERIRHYRSQVAWAQVEEQEKARDFLTNELVMADEAIENAETDLGRFDDQLQAVDNEMEAAAQHCSRGDEALEACQKEKEEIDDLVKNATENHHTAMSQGRQVRDHLTGAREAFEKSQQKVKDEELRLIEVSNGGYARKQEECQQAKDDAAAAKAAFESRGSGESPLREAIKNAEKKAQDARKQLDMKNQDLNHAKNRLQELTRENAQVKYGFPDKIPALLRAIEQQSSRFTSRPIGPIGHYVTLLQPKWASVIESSLGTTLYSFVVKNHGDQKTLSSIMKRVNCQCPILVGSHEHIDTSNNEPEDQYDTVLRVLQIDNDSVRAHLIIKHTIEKMLLIENLQEATSVMFFGNEKPKHVSRCFSIDSKDQRRGFHLTWNREDNPSQAPVMYTGYPRMKSDLASQTSHQREVVQHLESQVRDLRHEYDTAATHLSSCKRELSDYQRKTEDMKVEMQKLADHAESLSDALEKDDDGQLDALNMALKNAEAKVRQHEASLEDANEAAAVAVDKLKNLRKDQKKLNEDLEGLKQNCQIARQEQQNVANKRHGIITQKNAAIARIEDDRRNRDKVRDRRDRLSDQIVENIEKVSVFAAPRVPVDAGETAQSLSEKLSKSERDLQRYSEQLGASREEIANEAAATEDKYRRASRQVEEMRTLAQIFKDTLNNRKKRWEIFRSHISSRAKAQFTYLLSERGFRGQLLANHQEKLLDLMVEPDTTRGDPTGRGAKTLSGGEKSFSQICLLLALWEAMGSPIRCLDEFDVYMDHINRKMAIDMLMTAARRSIGRQFILITPGTKTDITIAPDVRVKELAEPERGQTTLAFQR